MSRTPASTILARRWSGFLLLAILCAAGTWGYVERVLIPYQIAEAAAHGRPRGNASDLYPRWVGARELLIHGRDPYSPEVTRDIQQGYYGRPLDPARPHEPTDQERFAYPVYVAFLLVPTLHQELATVRQEAFWVLLALTAVSTLLWLRVLRWHLPSSGKVAIVTLVLGSLPVVQGLKLEQLSLLVAALLSVAVWALSANRPLAAGFALALATIKPQLLVALVAWLVLWTVTDWRRRRRWMLSFLVTLVGLSALSEFYLPHWLPRFFHAMRDYRAYTDAVPIAYKLLPPPWAPLWLFLALAATLWAAWRHRACEAGTSEFCGTASFMMAATLVVIPNYSLYNQVLLLPALLWLARERRAFWSGGLIRRSLLLLTAAFLAWPWLASALLSAASLFLAPETVARVWAVPFWTALLLPVGVAGLMLMAHVPRSFAAHETSPAS